eukprot:CAMPEP_0195072888 /NCGR_PEP_ID=MMETSP0448-20130528/16356_1 /TAXON_ID=66468 /ORGANISM="Heterocapsa triquestra, Strain CCMP 448" /LENGTH=432 /DNA_ID=CAMNT_0040104927 /DNA_START=89 /DNA_END=1385 /DNA_ORIENTATION=-
MGNVCPCFRGAGDGPSPQQTPDFTSAVYWLAHPSHHPSRVRESLPAVCRTFSGSEASAASAATEAVTFNDDQETAAADVFFVHGTMEGWGNRASINRYEKEVWRGFDTHHQMTMVTAFTGVCRAYAPLYRQAGMTGDWDLAYRDVAAAFEQLLSETPADRPLILAGHSQGSMHIARLVKERVAPDAALLARVAGIYAPGAGSWIEPTPLNLEGASGVDGSGNPTVAMWATVTPGSRRDQVLVGMMSRGNEPPPSANPGTWVPGGHFPGALLPDEEGKPTLYRGLVQKTEASAQGLLELHAGAGDGAGAMLQKLNFGGRDFHAYDIHLLWGNVRFRVQKQVEAHLAKAGQFAVALEVPAVQDLAAALSVSGALSSGPAPTCASGCSPRGALSSGPAPACPEQRHRVGVGGQRQGRRCRAPACKEGGGDGVAQA